jgi:hypothetical protein
METELLPVQDPADADEQLTRRIRVIYKHIDGGLTGFFERMLRDRQEQEREAAAREPEKLLVGRLVQAAKSNSLVCGAND